MKLTKKITSGLILTSLLTFSLASCGGPTKDDAAAVAEQMLADYKNGAAVHYTEEIDAEGQNWEFILTRDADNNLFTSDIGVVDKTPFAYIEYRIDDVCYIEDNGAYVESATADYDPNAYFEDQITTVEESIKFCTTDTFDPTIETNFKVEGDNFVITGEYEEDDSPYTLIMSQDGKTMTYEDNTSKYTLDFNYSEKLALPN